MSRAFYQFRWPAQNHLQHQAERHARRAADERIPEIGNRELEIQHEHQRLRRQRRPKYRRAADAPDEKCHDKQTEHHAVKNGAEYVHGLNQIFHEVRVERKANRDQSPKCREHF